MTNIDELLANLGPECGLSELSDEERTYCQVVDSFKNPKTIIIDLSMFEGQRGSRVRQMWDLISTNLKCTNVDWKTKVVAVHFEHSESLALQFGELSEIIGLLKEQVKELYWTESCTMSSFIEITYCGEE